MLNKEELDLSRIPQHVAIIMDGNGRWAKLRGQERSYGPIKRDPLAAFRPVQKRERPDFDAQQIGRASCRERV